METKKFERRDQLIAAALEEFIDKDYEKASLNTIIKNANLSKGVFYYHFKNKESLYIALLEDASNKKWQYIKTHSNNKDFCEMDIFDGFLYQAKIGVKFARDFPKYHQLARMFSKEKGNPIYHTSLKYIKISGTDALEKMIKAAYQNEEIRSDYPISFTIPLLSHLFTEFDSIFYLDGNNDLEKTLELLEKYVEFMRYGLKP
ncbi:TetR/AcrR family transcriptional regulator [Anaerotignum sp.]|uniref:TetR/AcrR family transcriptional regulator n=1 Tax=Anaerotignum sp. TaxID=2039241 RepID=UPI002714C652|nr:TetR/AcrR family transcriptional regulator [Anaerotignum sp.]